MRLALRSSMACAGGRTAAPRSSMPSICSSSTARTYGASRSRIARPHWRGSRHNAKPGLQFNEHLDHPGDIVFEHACSSASRASCRSAAARATNPADRAIGSRPRTRTTPPCCGCSRRIGMVDSVPAKAWPRKTGRFLPASSLGPAIPSVSPTTSRTASTLPNRSSG